MPVKCQTEAGAFILFGIDRFQLGKGVKQFRNIFSLDPDTGVSHRYFDKLFVSHSAYRNISIRRGELDRIGKQVEQYLFQFPLVSHNKNVSLRSNIHFQRQSAFMSLFSEHHQ